MKISRTVPRPPPEFTMTFSLDEGYALVMALGDAYQNYPEAVDRLQWWRWAKDLDEELRRDA